MIVDCTEVVVCQDCNESWAKATDQFKKGREHAKEQGHTVEAIHREVFKGDSE